jgi:hypothetical protein
VLPSLSKAHQALFFQQKQKLSKLKLPVILFFKLSDQQKELQQNEAEQTETSSDSILPVFLLFKLSKLKRPMKMQHCTEKNIEH